MVRRSSRGDRRMSSIRSRRDAEDSEENPFMGNAAANEEELEEEEYEDEEEELEEEDDDEDEYEEEEEEEEEEEFEDEDSLDEEEGRRGRRRGSATKAAQFRGEIKFPLSLKFASVVGTMVVLLMIGLGIVSLLLANNAMEDVIVKEGVNTLRTINIYLENILLDSAAPAESASDDDKKQASIQSEKTKKQIQAKIKLLLKYEKDTDSEIKDILVAKTAAAESGKNKQEVLLASASGKTKFNLGQGSALQTAKIYGGNTLVEIKSIKLARDWTLDDKQVYVFENEISDIEGTNIIKVRLFLSPEKLTETKNRLYMFVGLAVVVAVILGILISLLLASWVSRPLAGLVEDIEMVSKGDLAHKTVPRSTDEIGLLARRFNEMTKKLLKAQKAELLRKMEQHELELASTIQKSLLPKALPQVAGFDIFAFYKSAKDVGGDYYDFVLVDQEHLGILVADVSGKGIPGSLVMSVTRSLIRLVARNKPSPAETLKIVNSFLARDIPPQMFVTCCYVVLNPATKVIKVCNAGHNPLLIYRHATRSVEQVKPPGLALGFDKGTLFNKVVKEQDVQLGIGDRVVLYTDGVVESMNEADEQWGDATFSQFISAVGARKSEEFVDTLVKALEKHQGKAEQHDDITIATFKVIG